MGKNFRGVAAGYGVAVKFSLMVTLPILCASLAGIFTDKKLGTAPWFTFILMIVGLAFSVYALYRMSVRAQEEAAQIAAQRAKLSDQAKRSVEDEGKN